MKQVDITAVQSQQGNLDSNLMNRKPKLTYMKQTHQRKTEKKRGSFGKKEQKLPQCHKKQMKRKSSL